MPRSDPVRGEAGDQGRTIASYTLKGRRPGWSVHFDGRGLVIGFHRGDGRWVELHPIAPHLVREEHFERAEQWAEALAGMDPQDWRPAEELTAGFLIGATLEEMQWGSSRERAGQLVPIPPGMTLVDAQARALDLGGELVVHRGRAVVWIEHALGRSSNPMIYEAAERLMEARPFFRLMGGGCEPSHDGTLAGRIAWPFWGLLHLLTLGRFGRPCWIEE